MDRKQWLVVISAMSLVVGGCSGGGNEKTSVPASDSGAGISDSQASGPRKHTVAGFLSDTGRTKAYDSALVVSLCQLEGEAKGLDSTKRICPTGNPRDVKIPTYPPYPPK